MYQAYSRFVLKFRWAIIAFWILLTVVSVGWLPQLSDVVARQGTTFLPDSSEVMQAQKLMEQADSHHKSKSTVIVAIRDASGLTQADLQSFDNSLRQVDSNHSGYHVSYVEAAQNTDKSVASSFTSKDGTTQIAMIGLPTDVADPGTKTALQQLHTAFASAPGSAHVYFTGDTPIQQDEIQISQSGAEKTALVTVVLVLVILLLVFRSVIAPFVTLISIGLSFLVASSVVAWLAGHGLPVSTFTQTFLIAVLFGAGTDYSIILMNRFREEMMGHHLDRQRAMESSLRAVSKTVIYSSLTVLVSFAVLYFANFGLYRSAVGVSVGIAITLLACLSFIPALMGVLGGHLYWPRKPVAGASHRPSRAWLFSAGIATRRPWWTIAVLAVILLPIALLFTNDRTFDPMEDIPSSRAVEGFRVVSSAFGPGRVMPLQIVLHTSDNLRSAQGLTTIENISKSMAAVPSVTEVDSATRPIGNVVEDFQLAHQNGQAADGLSQVQQGLGVLGSKLGGGASSASLHTGVQQLQSGAGQLASSSGRLTNGIEAAMNGAAQVADGARQAAGAASQLASGSDALSQSQQNLAAVASNLAEALAAWSKAHPDTMSTDTTQDPQWRQIMALAQAEQQGSSEAAQASQQVAAGARQLAASMPGLAEGASSVQQAGNQLVSGANQLTGGATQLSQGLNKLAGGTAALSSGLQSAGSGAGKMENGIQQVQQFLADSSQMGNAGNPGFYVPASEVSGNSDLRRAMDAYISPDGHIAKFSVVLNSTPYSMAAIDEVPIVRQAAATGLATSPVHTGSILPGGTTATQAELNRISNQDFVRTMTIILAAIFLLLVMMLKSVVAPFYIIISLSATYFVTMGILQQVAVHVLHHPGVSWSVPFFVFLLLVALGVDYSIFLMSRFDEEYRKGLSAPEAMRVAMGSMGNVILSAAVIMAGTFGSMTVAGVTSMVEIGLSVIVGLLLYTTVLLAFFTPACATVIGDAHGWPFRMAHPGTQPSPRLQADEGPLQ